MRSMKKFVVALVVATMVFAMVGSAFAAEVSTSAFADVNADSDYAEAFAALGALGVYTGNQGLGGDARPDDTINRAEFAAVVVRLVGKGTVAGSLDSYVPQFTDAAQIPSWAWGYVNVAKSLGVLTGYPDGSFRANNPVTHAEAVAMVTRALGNDPLVKGSWPINYVVYGADSSITDGVDIVADLPATRAEVAMMAYNALEVDRYSAADEDVVEGDTLYTDLYGDFEGVVDDVNDDSIEIDGEVYDLADEVFLIGADALEDLQDLSVKAYPNADDEVVAIETTTEKEVVIGKYDSYLAISGRIVLQDDTKVKVDDDTVYDLNGAEADREDLEEDDVLRITIEDDVAVSVKATRTTFADALLTGATTDDDETLFGEIEVTGTVAEEVYDDKVLEIDDETEITLNGKSATLADLEEALEDFDYAHFAVEVATEGSSTEDNAYALSVMVSSDTITGTVERFGHDSDGAYVRLDVDGDSETIHLSDEATEGDFDGIGDELVILLNIDGKARAALETVTEEEGRFYAIVRSFAQYEDDDDAKTSVTVELADGTTVEYVYDGYTTLDADTVYELTTTGSDLDAYAELSAVAERVTDGDVVSATSTYIRIEGGPNPDDIYPYADDVLIFYGVAGEPDVDDEADKSDIDEDSTVELYLNDDDEVQLVIILP